MQVGLFLCRMNLSNSEKFAVLEFQMKFQMLMDILPKKFLIVFQFTKKIIFIILALVLLSYLTHPGRFATSYSYILEKDMIHELEESPLAKRLIKEGHMPECPLLVLNKSHYPLLYPQKNVDQSELNKLSFKSEIKAGGSWKPKHCISRFDVAIIIPFRNREPQLQIFLYYIHPFLQKQMLNYHILVVEQTRKKDFNRAKLFNIGYTEALKLFPFHCFILHDVDLIPQKINNIYACTHQPRHMSSSLNTFRYNLPYEGLFGGAVAIVQKQFALVNGFSNKFFGWGGEDDDFKSRINDKGLSVSRFSPKVARYMMMSHAKEMPSETRFVNLMSGRERYDVDGLNSLVYSVRNITFYPLYTWLLVDV